MTFSHEERRCSDYFGSLSCGTRDCMLKIFRVGEEEIISGGFCPRGNSEGVTERQPDYVQRFHEILEKHFAGIPYERLPANPDPSRPTVGIRRCGSTIAEHAVWSSAVFDFLGFLPVLSPVSNSAISSMGTRLASTEYCVAMKLATGHAALLASDDRISHLFIPGLIDTAEPDHPKRMYCIYTEAEGFVLKDLLSLDDTNLLLPVWHLGDRGQMVRELHRVLKKAGYSVPAERIRKAFLYADGKTRAFLDDLAREGEKFLTRLEQSDEPGYIGTGRDYVLLDPEASSNSGHMFSTTRGMRYIPQIFLRHHYEDIPIDDLVDNEYWERSADILKASVYAARHPALYPIRLMNFACGPDSIKFFMEQEIFRRADKPFLHLMTDAQTNNAPFVTRAEAHQRVVERHRTSPDLSLSLFSFRPARKKIEGGRRH
jgi:predicted nucleotide-binding protein (sugar kinase/HSP70/actin superfamily)